MIRYAPLALALIAAAPAPAQRVDVALSNFKFTPSTIHFQHGQQYVLHLSSSGGHATDGFGPGRSPVASSAVERYEGAWQSSVASIGTSTS